MRMRTINQAAKEIRTLDPDTAVSTYYIRTLVNSGQIDVIKSGVKNMLDVDGLIEFLRKGGERNGK